MTVEAVRESRSVWVPVLDGDGEVRRPEEWRTRTGGLSLSCVRMDDGTWTWLAERGTAVLGGGRCRKLFSAMDQARAWAIACTRW